MKNTFRYALTLQDYISYYRMQFKRASIKPAFITAVIFVAMSLYYYISMKNTMFLVCVAIAVVVDAGFMLYHYMFGIKHMVIRSTTGDSAYFGESEITIDSESIEIKNLPKENEAGTIGIYPYSIMNVIFETEDSFCFVVGNEAKILPKRVIPQEMKELVFKEIKNNKNCIFVK